MNTLTLTLSRAAGEGTWRRHTVPSPTPVGEAEDEALMERVLDALVAVIEDAIAQEAA